MNFKTLLLILATFFVPGVIFGQSGFTEGRIIYDISFPDIDMSQVRKGTLPLESVVYIKGQLSKSDLEVGKGMSSSSIMNAVTGEVTALTEFMGNKSYIIMKPGQGPVPSGGNRQSVVNTGESKVIAGRTCSRVIVKSGEKTVTELYVTDEVQARLPVNAGFKDVKGFPMQFTTDENGLKMKFTARTFIHEKVADSIFSIPADYKLVTPQDLIRIYEDAERNALRDSGDVQEIEIGNKKIENRTKE